ncbi:MAG: ATP-binding domain-containing protein [Gammaproteobacteria bacterium]|nr:ATP-binding domain-containing protein [Gammaproteobacteria bacterium]
MRSFTGEYDRDGNQILSDGGIVFESIYRFKGQQAPAVIVVDVDTEGKETTRWQHRLYCCLTRASVRVDLLTNGELPSPS